MYQTEQAFTIVMGMVLTSLKNIGVETKQRSGQGEAGNNDLQSSHPVRGSHGGDLSGSHSHVRQPRCERPNYYYRGDTPPPIRISYPVTDAPEGLRQT